MPLSKRREKTIRVTANIPKELFLRLHTMESVRALNEEIGRDEMLKEALKNYLDNKGYWYEREKL